MTAVEPRTGLWMETRCRQCGDVLHEVHEGTSDGVRAHWVGRCGTCSRQFAVMVELVALRDPSLHDRKFTTRGAA